MVRIEDFQRRTSGDCNIWTYLKAWNSMVNEIDRKREKKLVER